MKLTISVLVFAAIWLSGCDDLAARLDKAAKYEKLEHHNEMKEKCVKDGGMYFESYYSPEHGCVYK